MAAPYYQTSEQPGSARPDGRPAGRDDRWPICPGEPCRQRIYRWARSRLGNHDDAEDLCQEVCYRCWKGRKKFRGEAKLTTWIYGIARNALADCIRQSARVEQPARTLAEARLLDEVAETGRPAEPPNDARRERIRRVRAALAKLPPQQRRVLVEKHLRKRPHAAIAAALGIKAASARQAVYRAREAFVREYERRAKAER